MAGKRKDPKAVFVAPERRVKPYAKLCPSCLKNDLKYENRVAGGDRVYKCKCGRITVESYWYDQWLERRDA